MSTDKRFLTMTDLSHLPQPQWLIEGLFERQSLVMMAGPSGSYKSFILIDWLCCMASGRKWNGRPTQSCKVAYALGEGKSSLIKRLQAWVKFNKLTPAEAERLNENFRVTFEVPQLGSKASTDNFLADLTKEGFKPDVVAIDTFARSMVGMDENDAKDTGMWVESADRLRQLGYAVIFLHHTKKNTEFGVQFRGSSAIIGAMDTAMTLTRSGTSATLKVTKQKDHDEGPAIRFRAMSVGIGGSDQSCVLLPTLDVVDDRFAPPVLSAHESEAPHTTVVSGTNDDLIKAIATDNRFPSDLVRAKELNRLLGMSLSTGQRKVKAAREGGVDVVGQ